MNISFSCLFIHFMERGHLARFDYAGKMPALQS